MSGYKRWTRQSRFKSASIPEGDIDYDCHVFGLAVEDTSLSRQSRFGMASEVLAEAEQTEEDTGRELRAAGRHDEEATEFFGDFDDESYSFVPPSESSTMTSSSSSEESVLAGGSQ